MNFYEMNALYAIASAPVIDLNAPLPVQVTPKGRATVVVKRYQAKQQAAVETNQQEYEPNPYDGTYSED